MTNTYGRYGAISALGLYFKQILKLSEKQKQRIVANLLDLFFDTSHLLCRKPLQLQEVNEDIRLGTI